jgi:L-amino acid N-acyltransferase YncA
MPNVALHRHCGFEPVDTLRSVGFKLGGWADTILMQRRLGLGNEAPPEERDGRAARA